MAIEAPISKFKKTNLKIFLGICIAIAIIFAYDGYLSKYKWSGRYSFYKKQVIDNDGKPTPAMNFNRKSPPFFLAGAVVFAVILYVVKDKKLIADENELVISDKKRIPYDSIQHIKTKGKALPGSGSVTESMTICRLFSSIWWQKSVDYKNT